MFESINYRFGCCCFIFVFSVYIRFGVFLVFGGRRCFLLVVLFLDGF